ESYVLEDGKIKFTDAALHPEPGVDYLRSLGANSILPRLTGFENEEAFWLATNPKMWDQILELQKFVVPPFPTLISTEEENTEISSILADMDTYRQEMLLKMITGKESLDKFEDYKAQMKKLGVDKLISIKQKQYDRVK
ncbi:MAG: bacterial extracellular solute-binding protein, partial [Paenibacillus sp.]|nr:bacterial extracellular solute-binding protein [Paenibacillus sp.]